MSGKSYCQNAEDVIKKYSIECGQWPNQKLYSALKDYKVICIGEMHGTEEPAEFLAGLVRTFTSNKRKIIVGFEIPEKDMKEFLESSDTTGLAKTTFFSSDIDGRGSEAWFRAIDECNKLGAKLCFFDNTDENRDEGMFERILGCYRSDSNSVMLTLSGNIHNRLLPWKDNKTMACYLKEYFGNKVYSIDHIYNEGTMYNRTSEGLKVHTIPPSDGVFAVSTSYDSYFIGNIFVDNNYSAYYYTKSITASLPRKQ